MKNMKKILALLVAVLMIAASVAAVAADGDPAPATTPDYDAAVSVTGLEAGDVAHFYKIVEWVGEAAGNVKGWKVVSPFNFDLNAVLVGNPNADPAVAPTGITAELANTLAATTGKGDGEIVNVTGTAAELDVTAEGRGAGIYMVLITPTNKDVVYNPVFVSSDYNTESTSTNNTWALTENVSYANEAAAKKSTTTLDKQASTTETHPDDVKWITTAIGDTVHFTVTTTIPGFGPAFIDPFFKMTDKLTDLTLVESSVQVVSPADAKAAAHIVTSANQYSIDWNEPAGKAYLATVATPTEVTVTYDAIVNTDAPYNVNFERNEVWTEFSHDINNTSDHSFKKDDTIHYTFTIDAEALANGSASEGKKGSEIVKIGRDAAGNPINQTTETSSITSTSSWQGPQAEAHFKLYRAYNETTKECSDEYIPKVKGTGADGTALDIVSGTDGRMTIAGLDAGEYWLREESCPAGFVKDTHVAHIVISTVESDKNITEYTNDGVNWISEAEYNALTDKTGYKSYTYSVKTLDSYKVTIDGVDASSYTFVNNGVEPEIKWTETPPIELPHQFINTQGLELPHTGGMGTTILYVGGSILVLAAVILLITKRRMNAED